MYQIFLEIKQRIKQANQWKKSQLQLNNLNPVSKLKWAILRKTSTKTNSETQTRQTASH